MTALSKNAYFEVLDDILDKYNNAYCTTIKMKPIDVLNLILMLNTMLILMIKMLDLK